MCTVIAVMKLFVTLQARKTKQDQTMRNRFLFISTSLIVMVSLMFFPPYASAQTDSIPAPDTTQVNIAFIGNSITCGATLSNPTTQCPPRRVQEILQSQGLTVNYINCAVSGYTTFHFLPVPPQSDGTGSRHAYVVDAIKSLSNNPGKLFVLIMLGTNDSAERNTLGAPVSTSTYYNNMKAIIDDIFSYNKEANVIVNYPIWYSPNTHNGATYLQAGLNRLKSYYPVIDSLVNYYQTQTVRRVFAGNKAAFTFFENNTACLTAESGYSGTFYLHPNVEGAKRLASFWAESILRHLNEEKHYPSTHSTKKHPHNTSLI